jgi:hypothetical protein
MIKEITMSTMNQQSNTPNNSDRKQKLNAELSKKFPKLSQQDIELYHNPASHDKLFAKLQEQGMSKVDAQRHLQDVEKSVDANGSGAAKSDSVKPAMPGATMAGSNDKPAPAKIA